MTENINLGTLSSLQGLTIYGASADKQEQVPITNPNSNSNILTSGYSVSIIGDINGDKINDIIIGAPYTTPNSECYVIYGSKSPAKIYLPTLTSAQGFSITLTARLTSISVSGAGDVNHDGYDDIIISGYQTYVIFGKASFLDNINLAAFTASQGFIIYTGSFVVSKAGDFNKDGYDDIVFAYPNGNDNAGVAYVIFGNKTLNNITNVNNLPIDQGIIINGAVSGDQIGYSVSGAVDINRDGYADIIIGAPQAYSGAGAAYVIYGNDSLSAPIDLAHLGSQGFVITGFSPGSWGGRSVSGAGDMNRDGYDDVLIGAPNANNFQGISYLIYGGNNVTDVDVSIASLQVISVFGSSVQDASHSGSLCGSSVSEAGDVNHDGFSDLLIGSYGAGSTLYGYSPGRSYVLFGNTNLTNIYLANLDISQGFYIEGATNDFSGYSVNGGFDVNGDNYDDILIGAPGVYFKTSEANMSTGNSYVIYGKKSGYNNINVITMDASQGNTITGAYNLKTIVIPGDKSGYSVRSAGDVNGDGKTDIIIGAPYANNGAGISYVIYGVKDKNLNYIDLSEITKETGFTIIGNPSSCSGWSVAGAGDVNGDGFDDVIIGAPCENNNIGMAYVIFGNKNLENIDLANIAFKGFSISGKNSPGYNGWSVSAAGNLDGYDENKKKYDDIIIGAPHVTTEGIVTSTGNGEACIIFGRSSFQNIDLSYTETNIVTCISGASGSYTGYSVSNAGNVNGKDYDDVIIGAPYANNEAGISYIIFGRETNNNINLAHFTSSQGYSITGAKSGDQSGWSVNYAGKINGDKYDDIIIGAPGSFHAGGSSYIVYGGSSLSNINLANLNNDQGFAIVNKGVEDQSGWSASGAGDINQDGYADLIIGAPGANNEAGTSYIIYGRAEGYTASTLEDLVSTQGFYIDGMRNGDATGFSVTAAGDFNGDTIDDVLVSAPQAYDAGGISYVIYGSLPDLPDPTPTLQPTIFIENQLYSIPIGVGSSLLGILAGWILRVKIAFYIINHFGYNYKLLYNDHEPLQPKEVGLRLKFDTATNKNQIFCINKNQEIPLEVYNGNNVGITVGLYNTLVSELSNPSAKTFTLMISAKNQIRDFLSSEKKIALPEDLGFIRGNIYIICLKAYGVKHRTKYRYEGRGIELSSTDQALVAAEEKHQPVHDEENSADGFGSAVQPLMSERELPINSVDEDGKSKTNYFNTRSCVLMSIDAMIDPDHVRLQNEAFARFGEDLFGYNFLTGNKAVTVIPTIKSPAQIADAPTEPAPTADNMHSSTSSNLMISLLSAQQIVEYIPIINYITQGFNITLPKILDNKPMLITSHLVLGNAAAALLPYESLANGMITSSIATGSYAMRLISAGYLSEQRQEALTQDKPMSNFEMAKYCGASMLAYTLPSIAKCAVTKWFIPEAECSFTGYDLGLDASLAGADCYTMYKATSEPTTPTTADMVIPYIADSLVLAIISQYVTLDMSSTATAMQSVKQCMSGLSAVVATDYMSRVAMDMVPAETKEFYIDKFVTCASDFIGSAYQTANHLKSCIIEVNDSMLGCLTTVSVAQEL